MRVLDLFSGIGGFSLGLERAGFTTVAFCEIEPFCQAVLRKHWPHIPIYDDIRTLTAERLAEDGIGPVDVICGGFPCIDISSSGKKAGINGKYSGLWRHFIRLICDVRPRYAIVENVTDLLSRGLGDILRDLASSGYDAEWHCIPASFFGLPQARERVWIIAYPNIVGCYGRKKWDGYGALLKLRDDDDRLDLGQSRTREAASRIRRMDDGIPHGVDRLRGLGNAVVPQIPEIIGRAIMQAEAEHANAD